MATRFSGEQGPAVASIPRSSKQSVPGKPPTARDSAAKWAAATATQKSRDAASSSLTPAAHTAAWCEQALLRESSTIQAFQNEGTLCRRVKALGINVAVTNSCDNPMVAILRNFIASQQLVNSVFEEIQEGGGEPARWRVVSVGVDEETRQRVAYYQLDTKNDSEG